MDDKTKLCSTTGAYRWCQCLKQASNTHKLNKQFHACLPLYW
jgi:hypothetical protein